MAEKEVFEYTYSAPAQDEVKRIREKYLPKEMTKLDQLRALDASVTKRGNAISIAHGILFALILGLGMSCCIVWARKLFVPGIIIGCIGLAGVAMTYPIYSHIVKQDREKNSSRDPSAYRGAVPWHSIIQKYLHPVRKNSYWVQLSLKINITLTFVCYDVQ